MSTVRLAGKLPDSEEYNGLDAWLRQFNENHRDQFVGITFYGVQKHVIDFEKSTKYPVLQVEHVEIIGTAETTPEPIRAAFMAARDKRLNRTTLLDQPVTDDGTTATVLETPPWELTDGTDIVDAVIVEEA
jgi:hypothetical protein